MSVNASAASANVSSFVFGKSGKGQNLICYKVSPNHPTSAKMLLNFEIHGWEDEYPRDGQVLTDYAHNLINYYRSHGEQLQNCTLYVIPSANPDGLTYGYTNNGPGRCQISLGIDLNRSFDWNFIQRTNKRNKTLSRPQMAPEAQSLANLVTSVRPNALIDFHGWDQEFIGSRELAGIFCDEFSVPFACDWSIGQRGFFAAWATKYVSRTALVEYPPSAAYADRDNAAYSQHTINAVNRVISTFYGDSTMMALDSPDNSKILTSGEKSLTVRGWALSTAGIKTVSVYLDGKSVGQASVGKYRPDVARVHGDYPGASNSGYAMTLPINRTALSEGRHTITVKALSNSGTVVSQSKSFISPGQLYCIDKPADKTDYESGSDVTVKGWAVNPCGINKVNILVGSSVYTAAYGGQRNDVNRIINSNDYYMDADKSGFAYTLTGLNAGTYEIRVQIIGNDGTSEISSPRMIIIKPAGSSSAASSVTSSAATSSQSSSSDTSSADNTKNASSSNLEQSSNPMNNTSSSKDEK